MIATSQPGDWQRFLARGTFPHGDYETPVATDTGAGGGAPVVGARAVPAHSSIPGAASSGNHPNAGEGGAVCESPPCRAVDGEAGQ